MAAPLIPAASGGNLADRLANRKTAPASAAGTGLQFVKFHYKVGEFTVGREELDITGEEFLVYTDMITHGWMCWPTRQPPQKRFVPFDQDLPAQPADIGDKSFEEARSVQFADPEDGTMMQLEGNTHGIRQGVDALTDAITARFLETKDPLTLYPLVKLTSRSYVHSTHGTTIHNPVFEVVGWSDREGNVTRLGEEAKQLEADEAETPPAGEETPAGVEPPAAEAPPTRRRRRKA